MDSDGPATQPIFEMFEIRRASMLVDRMPLRRMRKVDQLVGMGTLFRPEVPEPLADENKATAGVLSVALGAWTWFGTCSNSLRPERSIDVCPADWCGLACVPQNADPTVLAERQSLGDLHRIDDDSRLPERNPMIQSPTTALRRMAGLQIASEQTPSNGLGRRAGVITNHVPKNS
jgi:hypothetical protein